jgi:hypothetical protein
VGVNLLNPVRRLTNSADGCLKVCLRHLPECDALHCDPDGSRFVAKCLASLL